MKSGKDKIKIVILLLTLLLLSTNSFALPSEKTIRKVVYDLYQAKMKIDIVYHILREKTIKEKGMEVWTEYVLNAGKEEVMLHEQKQIPKAD